MVECIEGFGAEIHAHALVDPEPLVDRHVGIPRARSAQGVAAHHAGGKWSKIRYAQGRIERGQVVCSGYRQDLELVGSSLLRVTRPVTGDRSRRHNPRHTAVAVDVVRIVKCGEWGPAARAKDAGCGPAACDLSSQSASTFEPWGLPNRRYDDTVGDVVIRTAPIEHGIGRIEISQIANVSRSALGTVGKRRA